MSSLYPTLSLADGETPDGYVSRLARLHDRPGRLFCTDIGLTIDAISAGRPEALAQLENLAGLPPGTLSATAFQSLPGKQYLFRGEMVRGASLRRERVLVCPLCIAEDIANSPYLPPIVAAHDRFIWRFASVRTCPDHGVELVECGRAQNMMRGDVTSAIEAILPELPAKSAAAIRRTPSSLEVYLVRRLREGRGAEWVDSLDLHTLAKFSELAGAIETKGHDVAARSLSPQDWQTAGGAGFEVLVQGPAGIKDFVSRMWRSYPPTKAANQKAKAVLGILHEWLRQDTEGQQPICDVIVSHVIETMPVGPGDQVLGRPVAKRRLHSIYTAHKEFDIHPKRLRKLLALTGVIAKDHAFTSDHLCTFDADANLEILRRIANSLSLREAEGYLGVGRVHAKILFDNGFIKPFISAKEDGIGEHAFVRQDLDEFLERLSRGAVEVADYRPPIYPIAQASRRANRSSADVVGAILDGRLKWRGRHIDANGFTATLVNLDEVRAVLDDQIPDVVVPSSLDKEIGTSDRAALDLIREGFFKPVIVRNPKNRCPMNAIPRIQVERFRRKYVSLHELAGEQGRHPRLLKYELRDLGVLPAFGGKRVRATFYRRQALAGM